MATGPANCQDVNRFSVVMITPVSWAEYSSGARLIIFFLAYHRNSQLLNSRADPDNAGKLLKTIKEMIRLLLLQQLT